MPEAVNASETSASFQDTKRSIPDDSHLHSDRHENLKSGFGLNLGIVREFSLRHRNVQTGSGPT
jgi:hypothetical protein